jgi:hypothetical protein
MPSIRIPSQKIIKEPGVSDVLAMRNEPIITRRLQNSVAVLILAIELAGTEPPDVWRTIILIVVVKASYKVIIAAHIPIM